MAIQKQEIEKDYHSIFQKLKKEIMKKGVKFNDKVEEIKATHSNFVFQNSKEMAFKFDDAEKRI